MAATKVTSALAKWSFGYCAARGYGRPVPALNGRSLWFSVGKPDQVGRYVLADEGLEVLARIREPNIYVEIAGPRAILMPAVPGEWQLRGPAYLMVPDGAPSQSPPALPIGFTTERLDQDRSIEVVVRAPDGELAARGVVGIDGAIAVFDQIITEPSFRRRGLGSVVMHELAHSAETAGATDHLLIATDDGRALYGRLGWTVATEVVSIISPSR